MCDAEIARLREALTSETAAREKAERERAEFRDSWLKAEIEAYNLKFAAAGGEDAPGSAHIVTADDIERWRKEAAEREVDLTRKLEAAAGALVCAEQQCETAVYNISQRDHDDAVVRSFRSIAGYCAREARAVILGEEKS